MPCARRGRQRPSRPRWRTFLPVAVLLVPLVVALLDLLAPVLGFVARAIRTPPSTGRAGAVGRLRRVVVETPVPLVGVHDRSLPSQRPTSSGMPRADDSSAVNSVARTVRAVAASRSSGPSPVRK